MDKEAILYQKQESGIVLCQLCAHRCRILPGRRGLCQVRENRDGALYSLVYGNLVAENVDPIEKKPLYHFLPGTLSYSIATAGCNMSCLNCQNYQISTEAPRISPFPGEQRTAEEVVKKAYTTGSASIAYTYTEPTIYMEFALDCARLARDTGLANLFVTNGFMTPETLVELAPVLDAANIDLKGASEDFYRRNCKASLKPVLETIEALYRAGTWLEITTLLIPGLNDDQASLDFIAGFIAGIDPLIPWHISRFYPTYKMTDRPPTPLRSLYRARDTGRDRGLRYVYLGNVQGEDENTLCHQCGALLIAREGYAVTGRHLTDNGRCPSCGIVFNGVTGPAEVEFHTK